MFRSRKTKTEWISLNESFKDWKDAVYEVEDMGNRLDQVRLAIKRTTPGTWAHTHWTQTEEIIFRKWQLMVNLHTVGLRQVGPDRTIPINYNWFEGSDEVTMSLPFYDGICYWINERFGLSSHRLDRAWEMARDEKLQKARQGLA
jgi:hypothetical protein